MKEESLGESFRAIWMGGATKHISDLGLTSLGLALLASLSASLLLSCAYSIFYGSRATGSNIHRAFPLIGVATTAIFLCVQFSLPLSLGLLGSLSIVRFRTPVKEPEEIGFIMLVVASALCCASFNVAFLLMVMSTVLVALVLLQWQPPFLRARGGGGTIVVRCSSAEWQSAQQAVTRIVEANVAKPAFDSISSTESESVLTWSFRKIAPSGAVRLQTEIQKELPRAAVGIYFNTLANG